MSRAPLNVHRQDRQGGTPWTLKHRIGVVLWSLAWGLFCRWTPKPLYPWRLLWLRIFGARVEGRPFVHQSARINIPWHLTLRRGSCIGEAAVLYALDRIDVGENAVVAQESYLCTGTHIFDDPVLPLATAPIRVGARVFVGARAFVHPGIVIADDTIVGAMSVVTKSTERGAIVAGNPARTLRVREQG